MKFQRIVAIARKETTHVLRDWRSMVMALGTPAFLLLLFGYALTLDVDNVPIVIWDQSQTVESRELIDDFVGSRYFSVAGGYVDNYGDLEYAIDRQKASVGLVIPYDFTDKIALRQPPKVQLIVDGSDSNTATISMGYADAVGRRFSEKLLVDYYRQIGVANTKLPIDLRSRVWFNPDLESTNNIVPGLIAVIMMVITALLTSLTIAREWEKGTMEQLISTPVKVPEIIIGKMLPYFIIGLIDVCIIVLMGEFLFDVPMRGSLFLLFSLTVVFLIGALSFGMVISIATRSQLVASQFAMVMTFLPSFLLSGFISTITNMPQAIQVLSYAVPARYFLSVLKAIYLKGVGVSVLYVEIILLVTFATVLFVVANKKLKKKLVA